jgi:5-formyltetrahydrofolate cyclo-ligase
LGKLGELPAGENLGLPKEDVDQVNRISSVSDEKTRFRQRMDNNYHGRLPFLSANDAGRTAERLRSIPEYRDASMVLVSLHPSLRQAGLNALADRKKLVLPTPGLQKGFVLIDPVTVPPPKRTMAVRPLLRNPFGTKLSYQESLVPPIDLLICEGLFIGADGTCMGDGNGHLDLQFAILSTLGWLAVAPQVIALVDDEQILPSVPAGPTDVGVHCIVTPRQVLRTGCTRLPRCGIIWEAFDRKQVRRNEALFYLSRQEKALSDAAQ